MKLNEQWIYYVYTVITVFYSFIFSKIFYLKDFDWIYGAFMAFGGALFMYLRKFVEEAGDERIRRNRVKFFRRLTPVNQFRNVQTVLLLIVASYLVDLIVASRRSENINPSENTEHMRLTNVLSHLFVLFGVFSGVYQFTGFFQALDNN